MACRARAACQRPLASGPAETASAPSRWAMTSPVATVRAPSSTASVASERMEAVRSGSMPSRQSASEARTSSRARTLKIAWTASIACSARAASSGPVRLRRRRTAATSSARAPDRRSSSSSSSSSQAMDSGNSARRSVAQWALERTWHSLRAATGESRSIARYQCDPPMASDSRRKDSRPKSGSAPSPIQPMMTGSSWRWIAARRLTPSVRAWMWRRAPSGSV